MSTLAIISDIHGNRHALEAVLRRLDDHNVTDVICLGDIVGYGPFPEQCIDLIVKYCSIIIRGNHDDAIINPEKLCEFNGAARESLLWTAERLGPLHLNQLCRLKPIERLTASVMCVHDSPVPGPVDYVHDNRIASMAFRGVDSHICLLGHTHVPMVFEAPAELLAEDGPLKPTDVVAYLMNDGISVPLDPEMRYMCNPGSVGQPRDCDSRASYGILDLAAMEFTVHRAEYDIAAAQSATLHAGLPTILADRLAVGA